MRQAAMTVNVLMMTTEELGFFVDERVRVAQKPVSYSYTVEPSGNGWAVIGPSMKSRYARCEDAVRRCNEMNQESAHA